MFSGRFFDAEEACLGAGPDDDMAAPTHLRDAASGRGARFLRRTALAAGQSRDQRRATSWRRPIAASVGAMSRCSPLVKVVAARRPGGCL